MIDVLVWIIVLLPPLDWLAALILSYLWRNHPDVLVLQERMIAALIAAVAASVAGLMGWAFFGFIDLPPGAALYILALILILISVPSLYWLLLLVLGRFRIPKGNP
jgi:hypothetical protein